MTKDWSGKMERIARLALASHGLEGQLLLYTPDALKGFRWGTTTSLRFVAFHRTALRFGSSDWNRTSVYQVNGLAWLPTVIPLER